MLDKNGATITSATTATDGDSRLSLPREILAVGELDDDETVGTQDEENAIQTRWPEVGKTS